MQDEGKPGHWDRFNIKRAFLLPSGEGQDEGV
jgi:hypothetical protein